MRTITLYTRQNNILLPLLEQNRVLFSKEAYVKLKYGESAPIFLAAYGWFVKEAQKYVPRPAGAEYPYWAYLKQSDIERFEDASILKLEVPVDEVICFSMYDFDKILNMRFLGETEGEEQAFCKQLQECGVKFEKDVLLTNFYPSFKTQVQTSWDRLFRLNDRIKSGELPMESGMQAALWQIKKEWIQNIFPYEN